MSGYIGPQPVPQATQHRQSFVATANQTAFATVGYTPQFLDLYLNGVKLAGEDYTATNGSDVVLATGAAVGDILEYVAYTPFEVANQTFTGTTTTAALTVTGAFTSKGIDDNATATAMTLDASGNVMVGQASVNYNAVGASLASNGTIRGCVDGNLVGAFNRKTSDGTIVNFYKDGTTVGSIGVSAGDLTVGTGDVGLKFNDQYNTLMPFNVTTGSESDAVVDLGIGGNRFKDLHLSGGVNGAFFTKAGQAGIKIGGLAVNPCDSVGGDLDNYANLGAASNRWKDLYLSGGVYLGGTGAANKLDDYEEGAWTPVLVGASGTPSHSVTNQKGWYVKIGGMVHATMDWYGTNVSGGAGDYYFSGLPFAADAALVGSTGSVRLYEIGGYNPQCAIYGYTALAVFVNQAVSNSVWRWGSVGDIQGSTKIVSASIVYRTLA
jgi:hypothetical protein